MHYRHIVENQRAYFDTNATWDIETRKQTLRKIIEVIKANVERIHKALDLDLKRAVAQVHSGEIDCTIEEIEHTLKHLDEWTKPEDKGETPLGKSYIYKNPLGVVLVISPFNFPFQLAFRPAAAALAAGNTVIIKPSEYSDHTAALIEDLVAKNFDERLITVVRGGGNVAANLLEERFDRIFYTGGTNIGRMILRAAADHLTPVTLELGGKSPSYVDAEADLTKTVQKILPFKIYNSGQVCITTDYVLVHEKVKDQFIEALKGFADAFLNKKAAEHPLYCRIINELHWNRLNELVQKTKGQLIYTTGEPSDVTDRFIAPHVFLLENDDDILMEDEIFGPILPILVVKSAEEAIKFIRKREKPLSAYIFTENADTAETFLTQVLSGNSMVNDVVGHFSLLHLPFGGVGKSGIGRSHGKYDFDSFTHEKAVVKNL